MKRNWLVIANASRARVLEESDTVGQYRHVADLVHPQSRQKAADLAADRPGHVMGAGHGLGGTNYEPRTDPKEREHDRFAREVAAAVNAGVAEGRCAGLTLVASDPFLGHVKTHLSHTARRLLLRTVPADYTSLSDADALQRLF